MDRIRLERTIGFPREIVWEALVDPALVSGWLHPRQQLVAGVDALLIDEPDSLRVVSPVFGEVTFELAEVAGGSRGTSTRLTLLLGGELVRVADRRRLWESRLDQLGELLLGHPVDWRSWSRTHQAEDAPTRWGEARESS